MDEEEEMMWEAYDAGLCDDDESTKATTKSPLTATPKSAAPAPSSQLVIKDLAIFSPLDWYILVYLQV